MGGIHLSAASAVVAAALLLPAATQACVWSAIDHRLSPDESGIWNPTVYRSLTAALSVANVGGALWEGAQSRLGKTMWQGFESQLIAGASTTVLKHVFTRVRPSETDSPCEWFAGDSNYSFPSDEAAITAALVTPYVLEYGRENPAVYGLMLLPLYVGAARVKNAHHWQSDVLFGWAIGGLSGWYEHSRETPFVVEMLPHGVWVGLKTRF